MNTWVRHYLHSLPLDAIVELHMLLFSPSPSPSPYHDLEHRRFLPPNISHAFEDIARDNLLALAFLAS